MNSTDNRPVPRLGTVLLVDDDAATNFLHRRVFSKLKCADHIYESHNGKDAIDFLSKTDSHGNFPRPDLILLDINMPAMTGWEFLDAYAQLPATQKAGTVIVMVSTSENPADSRRASANPEVSEFVSKPLSVSKTREIVERYFRVGG